jgi:glyoxylase-like metal-dependent hydrolase (beta-lactamase superfamily II)
MTEESLSRRPHLEEKLLPLERAGKVELVMGEVDVSDGVRALSTPGHTPGHTSFRIESGGDTLIVLGDVFVHAAQLADPELVYASDEDAAMATETRKRVLAHLADDRVPAIAGHLAGAGRIARAESGFTWARIV